MSHLEQQNYIRSIKEKYSNFFKNVSVLEVGSLNINGSVRDYFENCFYTGIDVGPGPGVDIVCSGHEYQQPDNTYDVVISAECFEHNPFWEKTFENMIRMCKQKGMIIVTCATTGRTEHGTMRSIPGASPLTIQKGWDYYKNLTVEDFTKVFDFDNLFNEYKFEINKQSSDLYFYGFKK